jgi:malonyl-ACP decarboxylase
MNNYSQADIIITGVGVTASIGQGKSAFYKALIEGHQTFAIMQRPGRQFGDSRFIGAEIPCLDIAENLSKNLLRTASFSGQVAMVTLHEAFEEAGLANADPERTGLIIGGSNFQQRELTQTHNEYNDRFAYLRANYGLGFMDSDLCGLCSEQFGIKGFAYTLGGASASGQLAILKAIEAVQSNQVDICIAMGALMDLSYWECQGFRALGAMGSDRYQTPSLACRPFDADRDGFIFGESCGVVVIERAELPGRTHVKPYARLSGWGICMDANRNPNPSCEGEIRVIKNALHKAGLSPQDIDYINPHGTGSPIGDDTEIRAIKDSQLTHAYINATKSVIGHGLTSAGTVEVIATLLQMQNSNLHPSLNLENPIDTTCNWVQQHPVSHTIENALTLSMGFGGINTALCIQSC